MSVFSVGPRGSETPGSKALNAEDVRTVHQNWEAGRIDTFDALDIVYAIENQWHKEVIPADLGDALTALRFELEEAVQQLPSGFDDEPLRTGLPPSPLGRALEQGAECTPALDDFGFIGGLDPFDEVGAGEQVDSKQLLLFRFIQTLPASEREAIVRELEANFAATRGAQTPKLPDSLRERFDQLIEDIIQVSPSSRHDRCLLLRLANQFLLMEVKTAVAVLADEETQIVNPLTQQISSLFSLFCRDFVAPTLFVQDRQKAKERFAFFESWLTQLIHQISLHHVGAGGAGGCDATPRSLTALVPLLRSVREFFSSYTCAIAKHQKSRSYLKRFTIWLTGSLDPVDEQVILKEVQTASRSTLYDEPENGARCSSQELQVLGPFVINALKLTSHYGAKISESMRSVLQKHLPELLQQLINLLVSPDFFYRIAHSVTHHGDELLRSAEDGGVAKVATASGVGSIAEFPPELLDEFTSLVDSILGMGHPTGTTFIVHSVLSYFSHAHLTPVEQRTCLQGLMRILSLPVVRMIVPMFLGKMGESSGGAADPTPSLALLERAIWVRGDDCLTVRPIGEVTAEDRARLAHAFSERVVNEFMRGAPSLARLAAKVLPSTSQTARNTIEQLFMITQNPRVMRFFIYHHLIEHGMLPIMESMVAQAEARAEAERRLAPVALFSDDELATTANAAVEPDHIAFAFGQDIALFFENCLRWSASQGVFNRRGDQGGPFNRKLIDFGLTLLHDVVPSFFAGQFAREVPLTLEEQECANRSVDALATFTDDFAVALDQIRRRSDGASTLTSAEATELVAQINALRTARGQRPLPITSESLERRCRQICTLLLRKDGRSLPPGLKEALADSFAPAIRMVVESLSNPAIWLQMLRGNISGMVLPVMLSDTIEYDAWGDEERVGMSTALLKLVQGFVRLSEPGESIEQLMRMSAPLMGQLITTFPFLTQIVSPNPAAMYSRVSWANTVRIISSLMFNLDKAGRFTGAKIESFETPSIMEKEGVAQGIADALFMQLKNIGASLVSEYASPLMGAYMNDETRLRELSTAFSRNLVTFLGNKEMLLAFFGCILDDIAIPGMQTAQFLLEEPRAEAFHPDPELVEYLFGPQRPSSDIEVPLALFAEESQPLPVLEALVVVDGTSEQALAPLVQSVIRGRSAGFLSKEESIAFLDALLNPKRFVDVVKQFREAHPEYFSGAEIETLKALEGRKEVRTLVMALDLKFSGMTIPRLDAEESIFYNHLLIHTLSTMIYRWIESSFAPSQRESLYRIFRQYQDETTGHPIENMLYGVVQILNQVVNRGEHRHTKAVREKAKVLLDHLQQHKTPLNALISVLSALETAAFWSQATSGMRGGEAGSHEEKVVFFRAYGRALPRILAPLPRPLQAVLIQSAERDAFTAIHPTLPQIATSEAVDERALQFSPLEVTVCPDSLVGFEMKKALVQQAQHSIVMSGCYLGGAAFDELLGVMESRLTAKQTLKIDLTGSEQFLTEQNRSTLARLSAEYPNRFNVVITPEIAPFTNPHSGQWGLSSNHIKILSIDGGTRFLIGGSGTVDGWARTAGAEPLEAESPLPLLGLSSLPSGFRDTDFICSSAAEGLGTTLHIMTRQMIHRLAQLRDALPVGSGLFEPLLLALHESYGEHGAAQGSADLDSEACQTAAVAYLTGPDDKENAFLHAVVQAIDRAEENISIAHMYFHPCTELLQALQRALARGVQVNIISNKADGTTPLSHHLFVPQNREFEKRLLQGTERPNVHLYEYKHASVTYHKKIVLVDAGTEHGMVFTGSSNIGTKSLEGLLDFEMNLQYSSPKSAEAMALHLHGDIQHCDELDQGALLREGLEARGRAAAQHHLLRWVL